MYLPRAFVHQAQFEAAVARVARSLAPQVVNVVTTLGEDWRGEPAVFFLVILADSTSPIDQLWQIANHASDTIVQQVEPLEQWDVLPYFNFRSQTEQAQFNQQVLA